MGSSVIHAAAPPPSLPTQPLGLVAALPPMPDEKKNEKVDYFRLPCPVPYEEINREVSTALKPDCFEGFRFDFVKSLNQNFALSHGVSMGLMQDFPPRSANITKVPFANYEFGANYFDPKLMLVGRIMTDGRLNARFKCDLTDNLIMKGIAQITDEPHGSQGTCQFDYKGRDYRTQFQTGNPGLYTANYIQSVSPNLSLGAEVFWLAQQRRSGIGFSARYNTDKMVATAQVAGGGVLQLGYAQKVNEKVTLASDFMYNSFTGDVTASIGYDYILKQCRLRGKIDSSGVISALLEEQLRMGIGFLLSAEIDHSKKDYKFGFGLAFGGV